MSEIEKMYENAGVGYLMYVVDTFPPMEYPQIDFNEKKQLELIKWITTYLNRFDFRCAKTKENKYMCWCIFNKNKTCYKGINKEFDQALAGLICEFWQSLTPEEKQQIKEILE